MKIPDPNAEALRKRFLSAEREMLRPRAAKTTAICGELHAPPAVPVVRRRRVKKEKGATE